MSEAPKYDLAATLAAATVQNLIFVGRDMAELLSTYLDKNEHDEIRIDVVMFPYSVDENGQPQIAAAPRRGTFTGKLLSVLLNERQTKGRFVFSDGTVIYRDHVILE